MTRLRPEPLSAAAFAPYGDVIDADSARESYPINDGRTIRHHALARVDCAAVGGEAGISLFRAQPVEDGFVLQRLERHPLGSQAFINISGHPFVVVVAPPGALDERAIRAFLARPDQGVNYRRGTWHHYLLALEAPSDFIVVDRLGPEQNCDEQDLVIPRVLDLAAPRERSRAP